MTFIAVIPARYSSTRLPGKPLALIGDKPMIQHVWERAQESSASRVLVATDDDRVADACAQFSAECLMTRPDHETGTDRLAEVVDALALADDDIVVNVQGDEPLIPAAVIEQVATNLAANPDASIATLREPVTQLSTLSDPNAVKVVADDAGMALFFSRAPIPWPRDTGLTESALASGSWFRHLGIYAYRAGFLRRFRTWPVATLEATERLEQLRALQSGERIHVATACATVPAGVDTPEDLAAVRQYLESSETAK